MPKDFEVTLYFSGSFTTTVSAPDEEEAESVAYDELANASGDLDVEVTDSELCQVDGGYDG
jgi:hypothetical protein